VLFGLFYVAEARRCVFNGFQFAAQFVRISKIKFLMIKTIKHKTAWIVVALGRNDYFYKEMLNFCTNIDINAIFVMYHFFTKCRYHRSYVDCNTRKADTLGVKFKQVGS